MNGLSVPLKKFEDLNDSIFKVGKIYKLYFIPPPGQNFFTDDSIKESNLILGVPFTDKSLKVFKVGFQASKNAFYVIFKVILDSDIPPPETNEAGVSLTGVAVIAGLSVLGIGFLLFWFGEEIIYIPSIAIIGITAMFFYKEIAGAFS